MGLDMYLSAEHRLFSLRDNNGLARAVNAAVNQHLEEQGSAFRAGTINNGVGSCVRVDAAYWRKANAIHKWFVDNVQDGTDDCERYYVSREQLADLAKLCAVEIKAYDNGSPGEFLPTMDGFFFGSTNYDEWYRNDLEETIRMIENALQLPEGWEFYYQSSW